jgi:two-component sensor histidine kinase
MRPFVTTQECLKCHAQQGYKVGDVRGGISVEVPLSPYLKSFKSEFASVTKISILIWLSGVMVLFVSFIKLRQYALKEIKITQHKEILLRELNHRVKNNLQIIVSIIGLHLESENDYDKEKVLSDIQGRILTMATMHDMFTIKNDTIGIEAEMYFMTLCANFVSMNDSDIDISCSKEIDSFNLPGTTALSCGMIVNELMTNTYKYAFNKDSKDPSVTLKVTQENGIITLSYNDNGIGFDYEKVKNKSGSYGFMLIDSMADKLNAKATISGDNGTDAKFVFSLKDA